MSLELVSETDPVTIAWNAFDAEALRLQAMYVMPVTTTQMERLEQSLTTVRAWQRFSELFIADNPAPGAA